MTFFSLTLDADGHWLATCDRCSRDLRSTRSHKNMSITMLADFVDDLHEHFHSHPVETNVSVVDEEQDIGGDEDVKPLAGALNENGAGGDEWL